MKAKAPIFQERIIRNIMQPNRHLLKSTRTGQNRVNKMDGISSESCKYLI